MQALSIYILIRLDEGETDHNNLDSLLLATVTVLSKQFAHNNITHNTQHALHSLGREISWKDWIFEESTRRLVSTHSIARNLMFSF